MPARCFQPQWIATGTQPKKVNPGCWFNCTMGSSDCFQKPMTRQCTTSPDHQNRRSSGNQNCPPFHTSNHLSITQKHSNPAVRQSHRDIRLHHLLAIPKTGFDIAMFELNMTSLRPYAPNHYIFISKQTGVVV